jgi:hypothetical protein
MPGRELRYGCSFNLDILPVSSIYDSMVFQNHDVIRSLEILGYPGVSQ